MYRRVRKPLAVVIFFREDFLKMIFAYAIYSVEVEIEMSKNNTHWKNSLLKIIWIGVRHCIYTFGHALVHLRSFIFIRPVSLPGHTEM